jgi:hypothetical protein
MGPTSGETPLRLIITGHDTSSTECGIVGSREYSVVITLITAVTGGLEPILDFSRTRRP